MATNLVVDSDIRALRRRGSRAVAHGLLTIGLAVAGCGDSTPEPPHASQSQSQRLPSLGPRISGISTNSSELIDLIAACLAFSGDAPAGWRIKSASEIKTSDGGTLLAVDVVVVDENDINFRSRSAGALYFYNGEAACEGHLIACDGTSWCLRFVDGNEFNGSLNERIDFQESLANFSINYDKYATEFSRWIDRLDRGREQASQ